MPSLVEILPVVLGKKIFLNFFNDYLLFRNYMYLSLEKGVSLLLNKFDFSSPKYAFCQVWLKLAQWFWRRFLNFRFFLIISPCKRA